MNRTLKTLSALLAACLLLPASAGCFKIERIDPADPGTAQNGIPDEPGEPGEPEPQPQIQPDPEPAPEPEPQPGGIGFTMAELAEKNDIRRLLTLYDSVSMKQEFFQGNSVYSFWLLDGELVEYYVNTVTYEGWGDGEPMTGVYQGGWHRGLDFEIHPDQPVTATVWLSQDRDDGGIGRFDPSGTIRENLPSFVTGEPELLDEDEKTLTVRVEEIASDGAGGEVAVVSRITVERDTLAVLSMESSYTLGGVDYSDGFTVEYGGERLGTDVMEDWEATRTVSFDFTNEANTLDSDVTLPENWKLEVWGTMNWFVSDTASRPGGDEYAVAPGTGSVTLYIRDEANLPKILPGWDALGFTRDELLEANRIWTLTGQYGTVVVREESEGWEQSASFFRWGDSIAQVTESVSSREDGSETRALSGNLEHLMFSRGEDGYGYAATAVLGGEAAESEDVIVNDRYLEQYVPEGPVSDAARGADGSLYFRITDEHGEPLESGDPAVSDCVAEGSTRLLVSVDSSAGRRIAVSAGEEVPFAEEFARMFENARTVAVHAFLHGEEREYRYTLPADWPLTFIADSEAQFYSDPGLTAPAEPFVPADGQPRELWVSTAKG
ncbi:MAG: hypothetical protein E7576_11230 [Ruminococcaceae bacterium]|jgi:hypothetical protein|nr:hypothetical protein [Oscillospiraceae bacterium]